MTSAKAFFITGTDTDVGKTLVSCALLAAARAKGMSTAALKPVAAGISDTPLGQHNADVVALHEYCTMQLEPEEINPVCLADAIAPHIAANKTGTILSAAELAAQCRKILDLKADLTVIEGAGGWKVPLNDKETMADMVKHLNVPVILVVGLRLGCLNHALLTAQSVLAEGLPLAGWIANHLSADMPVANDNIDTLKTMLPAPLLGEIPWLESDTKVARAAEKIHLESLVGF